MKLRTCAVMELQSIVSMLHTRLCNSGRLTGLNAACSQPAQKQSGPAAHTSPTIREQQTLPGLHASAPQHTVTAAASCSTCTPAAP
jgi:hypothetical protein